MDIVIHLDSIIKLARPRHLSYCLSWVNTRWRRRRWTAGHLLSHSRQSVYYTVGDPFFSARCLYDLIRRRSLKSVGEGAMGAGKYVLFTNSARVYYIYKRDHYHYNANNPGLMEFSNVVRSWIISLHEEISSGTQQKGSYAATDQADREILKSRIRPPGADAFRRGLCGRLVRFSASLLKSAIGVGVPYRLVRKTQTIDFT